MIGCRSWKGDQEDSGALPVVARAGLLGCVMGLWALLVFSCSWSAPNSDLVRASEAGRPEVRGVPPWGAVESGGGARVEGKPTQGSRLERVGPWIIDLDRLVELWPEARGVAALEDAFELEIVYEDRVFEIPTHLFPGPVRVIPFADNDTTRDAAGDSVERGDAELARLVPHGSLLLAVKSHRPMRRRLSVTRFAGAAAEELGLADTHLSVVVGIERNGAPGIATVSMPQGYAGGRIGDNRSPPVFLTPVWPKSLSAAQIEEFESNIRTYLVGFHSVGRFSFRYFHGDQLAAHDEDSVLEHVAQMIRAVSGDQAARAWFSRTEQQFYCSELAYLAFSAGLTLPLNAETMVPIVGEDVWRRFAMEIERHSEDGQSAFTKLSRNPFVSAIDLTLASADFESIDKLVPSSAHGSSMVFPPMSAVDIVEMFLRHTVPRETLGESDGALLQAAVLEEIGADVIRLIRAAGMSSSDEELVRMRSLLKELQHIVATSFADYSTFRKTIEPVLHEARKALSGGHPEGVGLFALPSLFHLVAEGEWPSGRLGLRYVGHGVPFSVVMRAH